MGSIKKKSPKTFMSHHPSQFDKNYEILFQQKEILLFFIFHLFILFCFRFNKKKKKNTKRFHSKKKEKEKKQSIDSKINKLLAFRVKEIYEKLMKNERICKTENRERDTERKLRVIILWLKN